MCGIIGVVIKEPCGSNAVPYAIEGLFRLEYRGYDSAGVALITKEDGRPKLQVFKARGPVSKLIERFSIRSRTSRLVVGHTRWATHGPPSDVNAHPHVDCTGSIAVVHNGIIRNYLALRRMLEGRGHIFRSETDTEVIAHLLEEYRRSGLTMLESLRRLVETLEGSFAIAIVDSREPSRIYFARRESPLYAAVGECIAAVSSDIPSLLHISKRIVPIEDDEYGYIEAGVLRIYHGGVEVEWSTRVRVVTWSPEQAAKGGYPHFMLKEIMEQPRAVYETLMGIIEDPSLAKAAARIAEAGKVIVTGAGTSFHAGLVYAHFSIKYSRIAPHALIASEFSEYIGALEPGDVVIAVSQSGETTDTLNAVREARKAGATIIAVTNVVGSTLSRLADITLYTRAGPEIGVAATKTFLTQVLVLQLLAAWSGVERGVLDRSDAEQLSEKLVAAREAAARVESMVSHVQSLARILRDAKSMFILGRGLGAHLAREAALKVKEIAYIHAEAYPAGESKHGPIALVEPGFPVVFVGTPGVMHKLSSNIEEMKARGATTIVVGVEGYEDTPADYKLIVGPYDEDLAVYALMPPLQLLAYELAVMLGRDPDRPRNLAKTVTVE